MTRIIGIDAGLLRTGWGVIAQDGTRLTLVACGVILPPAGDDMGRRLSHIHTGLAAVLATHKPAAAAVEDVFANTNPATTMKLGMARGAALLALAQANLSPASYAPNTVKKSLVGRGHAGKDQVAHMVRLLLPATPADVMADVTDALAVAICHAHHGCARAYAGL